MKIEKQLLENHEMKLTVEVEPDMLESTKRRAARELSRRHKIPGFRPGKAPYAVILRQVGEEAILEESIHMLADDIYPKAIEEAAIHPYGPGSLEGITSTTPPVFEFIVPLEAEVTLGDYQSIRRPYEIKSIPESEVLEVLENLRDRQVVLEPVERPAQEGDVVTVRLSGARVNKPEDEKPGLIREQSIPITIWPEERQTDQMRRTEWPYSGFAKQLIGLSLKDEKTYTHTFPEDSSFESLRGVDAEYHVVVEEIKYRILPEMNDDFAKSVGDFETMDLLKTEIRKSLEEQVLREYNEEYDEQVIDELIDDSSFRYAPKMLADEIDEVIAGFTRRLEKQGTDLNLYLKSRSLDMDGLREEASPVAEKRLKRSLALMEIAKAENIQVKPEELQTETARTVDMLSQTLSEREAKRLSDRRVVTNIMSNLMIDMVTQRALEQLRAIASNGQAPNSQLIVSPTDSGEDEIPEPIAIPTISTGDNMLEEFDQTIEQTVDTEQGDL